MSRILENRLKPYIFGTVENRKEKAGMLLMGTIVETVGRKTMIVVVQNKNTFIHYRSPKS